MNQLKFHQQVGISVMKVAIEAMEVQDKDVARIIEQWINPNMGKNIDIKI